MMKNINFYTKVVIFIEYFQEVKIIKKNSKLNDKTDELCENKNIDEIFIKRRYDLRVF